uniref:hypothetical protein n=1 Tax=Flavobacterium sp. TaxID=239 RepID=UPI00404A87A5
MPGEGFMMDALRSLKNNRRDRTSKTSHLGQKSGIDKPFIDKNKATKEDLHKIRTKIQNEEKEARKKMMIKTVIVVVLVLVGFWILDNYWKEMLDFISIR